MMDIEFTIQQRKLYMLQCRVGKRTAFAAIRIAVDMARERLISRDEALRRVRPRRPGPPPPPPLPARAEEGPRPGERGRARGGPGRPPAGAAGAGCEAAGA